jgi:1-phosphofructokinase family hexose kinase
VVLIVSPNLTVDRTVRIPRLVPGEVLRPHRAAVTAGSKGVNVGRVLATLGSRARLVGFVPDDDRAATEQLFASEPIELVEVPIAGQMRVATIYLEDDGRVTVLNEPGPETDRAAWERLERRVEDALAVREEGSLVCSGSLPPGAPVDAYGRLSEIGHRAGVEVVVDAARDALAATLPHHPDMVTPNLAEAEGALGWSEGEAVDELGEDAPRRSRIAAAALVDAGARAAVVTAGAAGAAWADGDQLGWFDGVPVEVVNPIGAGDSFVGGYVHARRAGAARVDAVAHGLATASASCEQALAGGLDPERVARLVGLLRFVPADGGGEAT